MTAILSSSFAGSVGHDDMYIFIIVRIEVLVPVKAKVQYIAPSSASALARTSKTSPGPT